jgi:alpha-L-fucosidase
LQPNVIINERLHGYGDYYTPEQSMPAVAPSGPWEMCLTLGRHWGWTPDDTELKSPQRLLRTLIEVTSRGGNLLLNTGIRGDGSIDPNQRKHFGYIEEWMKLHQRSVIGVEPASGIDFYGPITRTKTSIFLHLLFQPINVFTIRGLPVDKVKKVILMSTGEELPFTINFEVHHRFKPGEDRTGEMYLSAPKASGAIIDVIEIQLI